MAYDLSQRFRSPPLYYRILDPGAYQKVSSPVIETNKVPFLSNTPRRSLTAGKLWTHAIYNTDIPANIVDCSVFKSKVPRFPYKAMTKEDYEEFLCQCGIRDTCECSTSDHEDEVIVCQGKIRRRLFKGPTPEILRDSSKGTKRKETLPQPPFYDARVIESTSYYRGCKWSLRTSKRSNLFLTSGPGPADYYTIHEPSYEEVCAEKVRAHKRKTSKQLRYIEFVQERNITDGFPGPGSYNPRESKGTNLSYLGPKAERFSPLNAYEIRPGPADHFIKRCFDPFEIPDKRCHANLVEPAAFGSKAVRLKHKCKEGPSPASYNVKFKTCNIVNCSKAPFGTSTVRFKETVDDNDENEEGDIENEKEPEDKYLCLLPTWEFRSRTIRFKPLSKRVNEPSPADLPQFNKKIIRSTQLQNAAPFFRSDPRFRPWYNWIPVHGAGNTPGPCYYSSEKPKCLPAVRQGPLCRSPRFKPLQSLAPSPNQYNVGGGIENILATHNERLKENLRTKHKFTWKPKMETRLLSDEEKENILLNKSIELLNV